MTPKEFLATPDWQHRRKEVMHEILAVCLPVILYTLAKAISDFIEHPMTLAKYAGVPDGLFGGCILYAMTIVHSINYRGSNSDMSTRVGRSMSMWPYYGLLGIIVCAALSVVSAIFHPVWSLPIGIVSIYFGGLAYKSAVFCRTYLECLDG